MGASKFNNVKTNTVWAFATLMIVAVAGNSLCVSAHALDTAAGWRMDGEGYFPNATPPTEWSKTKNVIWSTPMTAWSNASPVLMGGMLYFCAEPESLLCADAATGKVVWEKTNTLKEAASPDELVKIEAAEKDGEPIQQEIQKLQVEGRELHKQMQQAPSDDLKAKMEAGKAKMTELKAKLEPMAAYLPPKKHETNGYSSSTPVTDGKNVFGVFGNGVVGCYSTKGDRVWIRHIENPTEQWGHSTSPVLSGDKLFVQIVDLYALDAATGKTLWTAKAKDAWGTPIEVKLGDTPSLLTPAGDLVRISDGHVMATKIARDTYCSPIVRDGIAYYFDEEARTAVKLPTAAADTVTPEILWSIKVHMDRYYSSPVLHDGLLYAVHQKGMFSVVDAKTGAAVYEKPLELGGTMYPSVTMAGKYLYVASDNGATLVLQPGNEYKEIARNTLEPGRATPVFEGKRIYIRSYKTLFCVGDAP